MVRFKNERLQSNKIHLSVNLYKVLSKTHLADEDIKCLRCSGAELTAKFPINQSDAFSTMKAGCNESPTLFTMVAVSFSHLYRCKTLALLLLSNCPSSMDFFFFFKVLSYDVVEFYFFHQTFFIPSILGSLYLIVFVSRKPIFLYVRIPRASIWHSNCWFTIPISAPNGNVQYIIIITIPLRLLGSAHIMSVPP